jgi:hypothetical protein
LWLFVVPIEAVFFFILKVTERKEKTKMYYPNYFQQPQQITEVNGEAGANAYNLAANSSVMLLDTQQPICYVVKTDGAGYKTVMAFDMTPHVPKEQVMMNSIEERLKKLEEMINGKSDTGTEQSGKYDDSASEV